jgi:hypothetical protein
LQLAINTRQKSDWKALRGCRWLNPIQAQFEEFQATSSIYLNDHQKNHCHVLFSLFPPIALEDNQITITINMGFNFIASIASNQSISAFINSHIFLLDFFTIKATSFNFEP